MPRPAEIIYLPEVSSILADIKIPPNIIIAIVFVLAIIFAIVPFAIIYWIAVEIRCLANPELAEKLTVEAALKRIENNEPPIK